MSLELSSTSLQYVKVPVTAIKQGAAVDPTADTVKLAFPAVGTAPATWYSGSWETAIVDANGATVKPIYYARCLVGPAGAVTLAAGFYDIYVQVTDSPEIPVVKATDTLEVY